MDGEGDTVAVVAVAFETFKLDDEDCGVTPSVVLMASIEGVLPGSVGSRGPDGVSGATGLAKGSLNVLGDSRSV